jgi:hypothetical protein
VIAGALLLLLLLAAPPGEAPCDGACDRRAAERLLEEGDVRGAVARLRTAVASHPEDPALPLLLARAYLLEGNLFWAEATLRTSLELRPGDPEASGWLALVHLRQGDPELARRALGRSGEPAAGPERSRRALLEAWLADLDGTRETGLARLAGLDRSTPVFPEDRPAWDALVRRLDPWRAPTLSVEGEIRGGATSNALAGAPTDPGGEGTASGLADATLLARLQPRLGPAVDALLELSSDGHLLAKEEYRELSSLTLAARPGLVARVGGARVLGAFRWEVLHLDQSPSRYSEARRAELEVEWAEGWLLFGGGGHRDYRDERRTRDEWDAGFGGPLRVFPGTSAVFGATLRGASARSPAYDLLGASLALAATVPLGRGASARLSGTFSWDDYPHSGGAEGLLAFGTTQPRRDLTGRVTLGLWLRVARGLKAGVEGQLARRDSTADDLPGFDFDYTEARGSLLLRFELGADRSAPAAVPVSGHVPLEWGLGRDGDVGAERIIDLLRQDEELRRGGSCGVR